MIQLRTWPIALAVIAVAACSKKTETAKTDSAAGSIASAPAASPTADSAHAAAPASGGAMSDANILAKENGGDSAEVAIATFVRAHSSDAAVKAYAAQLVSDHGKGQKEVQALSKKLSIAMQPPAGDTTSQMVADVIAHLGTLKGHDLDTAFVQHEIEDHKADIDDAHKASAAAQNAEVKALVEKSLPELQSHLDKAQALEKKLAGAKG